MRIDLLLVQRELAPNRSAAQRLIARGAVRWLGPAGWAAPTKAGEDLPEACEVVVTDDAELRWASRAGLKLEAAIARTGIDVQGRVCLDAGQSTGGFTDVLLARGAAQVVGFDVGHGQLLARLRADPRVVALEGLHVRQLAGSALAAHAPAGGFGLVVADLSFISLAGSIAHLAPWLAADGDALLLVKPQFEVGPQHVGKGGVVRDPAQYPRVEAAVREACVAAGWSVLDYFPSAVTGGDGNREFFVRARPSGAARGATSP
jgi:23S rRNA (cytidine1920-2'-O)/16S rRNA (cytidine1409-2'-O)-methyltransferase